MSDQASKHPQNVPGRFYVTEDCLACESCQDFAPKNFRYVEYSMSYVFMQPETSVGVKQCLEGLDHCPLEAIRDELNN